MFHALVDPAAEAAIRSVVHEVSMGRSSGEEEFADSIETIACLYPEVLEEEAQEIIVKLYKEASHAWHQGLAAHSVN